MMTPYDIYQQNPLQNLQQHWAGIPQQSGQTFGSIPGQAAYGQQPFGGQMFGQSNIGYGQQGWGQQQQRQLSQHEVGEVVRQLIPLLPQILAQAQLPQTGIGYGAYGQAPRTLTQQDVTEVARHILSIAPQLAGMSQGWQGGSSQSWQGGSMGGSGQGFPQQSYGQQGFLPFQAAFGASSGWGQQRQLTPQDVSEVLRHVAAALSQSQQRSTF